MLERAWRRLWRCRWRVFMVFVFCFRGMLVVGFLFAWLFARSSISWIAVSGLLFRKSLSFLAALAYVRRDANWDSSSFFSMSSRMGLSCSKIFWASPRSEEHT